MFQTCKIKPLEIIIRDDIIEKNIIIELANGLKESKLLTDFSSVAVPPVLVMIE